MPKRFFILFTTLLFSISVFGCGTHPNPAASSEYYSAETADSESEPQTLPPETKAPVTYFEPSGMTLETRILPPKEYTRIEKAEGSFADFLSTYTLKESGSPVLLYDGSEKYNQHAHAAVFALPIEPYDLQQCADSVMRMYAEYYYSTGQFDKIQFHFTNGFLADYKKWSEGYRIAVSGNNVSWTKKTGSKNDYDTFVSYMKTVFTYAGTLSMESETEPISVSELQIGDVFLKGGSPGHVVMVVDICQNMQGKKAVLLAQGYMPAQEFHVLNNPMHTDNPWYYEEELTGSFQTPEYSFSEEHARHLLY